MKRFFCLNKGLTISELLTVFVLVMILAGLLFPLVKYNTTKLENVTCSNNLREIGLALYIYAREHNGKFPPTLMILYEEQYLAEKELMDCPATKRIGTPENSDYVYTTGLTVKDSVPKYLVCDKENNHSSGVKNVLYVNGAVGRQE
ncbi:MAG: hypothetical protein ABH844_03600 [Candidatus Omnitrophota bacterium]